MENTITFNFNCEEYHRFVKSQTKSRYRWLLIVGIVCVVGILVLSTYGYYKTGTTHVFNEWVPLLICIVVWFVFIYWWFPRQVAFNKLNQRQLQKTTISITDSYLQFSLESGFLEQIPYIDIVKVELTDEYAMFWKNYIDVVIVPRYAFESTEHYEMFAKGIISRVET